MSVSDVFGGGVAVITGAGAGIGSGLAREAARIGMTVIVADIASDRAQSVATEIRSAGGKADAIVTDVRDPGAVQALAEIVYRNHGDVRLLINNAGIEMLGLLWELTPAQWQAAMEINVNGIFYGIRYFVPRMIESIKRGKQAAIANLSSVGGMSMSAMMAPYIVSKHAVLSLTECLALEMQITQTPIDVSVIVPGMVRTSIFEDAVISRGTETTWADRYRIAMRDFMASDGMELSDASRFIFEQLAAREFWVSTQPNMTEDYARSRSEYLAKRPHPALSSTNVGFMRSTRSRPR